MNYEDLKPLVESVKGTTFAGLDTLTTVALKGGKKNTMQGRVTKRTTNANIMLFSNSSVNGYEAMVKRRMLKEGKDPETFTVKPRAWGHRIGTSPFIEHNGKHYLECIFVSPGKSEYFLDGNPIAKEDIEGIDVTTDDAESSKTGDSAKNDDFRNSDLINKVIIRTFSLDAITEIRLNGETIGLEENS